MKILTIAPVFMDRTCDQVEMETTIKHGMVDNYDLRAEKIRNQILLRTKLKCGT